MPPPGFEPGSLPRKGNMIDRTTLQRRLRVPVWGAEFFLPKFRTLILALFMSPRGFEPRHSGSPRAVV